MNKWVHVAAATMLTLMVATAAACSANGAIDETFQGVWNCSVVMSGDSAAATVTVNDGTYQVSSANLADAGTWSRSGDTVTITSDSEGLYTLLGVPGEVAESMSVRLRHEDSDPQAVNATFADDTLRFGYGENQYTCTKSG
jgi:hypothetical protein